MLRPKGYYSSKRLKGLRASLLEAQPYCSVCENTGILVVHHRTYANWPNEKLEDLTILCQSCHISIHANIDRREGRSSRRGYCLNHITEPDLAALKADLQRAFEISEHQEKIQ